MKINELTLSQSFMTIFSTQSTIDTISITKSSVKSSQNTPKLIEIVNFQNSIIKNISCTTNKIPLLYMSQQVSAGYVLLDSSKFMDINLQNDIPLISLENILIVQLNQLNFKNITIQQNLQSSILVIYSCNQVKISESLFISNSNQKGKGGSIQAIDNQFVDIENSLFIQNKCLSLNGGALFISNSVFQAEVMIQNSIFDQNTAIYSTGGAIHLENSNLKMFNTSIFSNEAAIGGGVFYQQIIPDFILDFQKGIVQSNKIINNKAKFFGKNFGSTLRTIKVNLDNIKVNNQSLITKNNSLLEVIQLKSGNQISFQRIQILDEENNPVIIPNSKDSYLNKYCSSVQALIQEVSISVEWDQNDTQIQCIGQLQTNQFINNGFQLYFQVMYKPLGSTVLKLVSNTISELQDSKQQVYIKQGKLEQEINVQFLGCSIGDVLMHQEKSIICEQCPDGKYSLNLNDTACQQCPDSAIKCIGSNIYLKNGYWRENEQTDNIVYCDFNPNSCQAESNLSKMNCIQGYKGPICKSCDTYGDVWDYRYSQLFDEGNCYRCSQNILYIVIQNLTIYLFASFYVFGILKKIISSLQAKLAGYFINKADIIYLGTTITDKDKSQIVSKILTDHLQMLSLLKTLQISIPSYFSTSIGLSGNPLRVTSSKNYEHIGKFQLTTELTNESSKDNERMMNSSRQNENLNILFSPK
ncbi:transmembrane protein, putative (macronuclear) [Tetrahymena thermophila SB210]|uniref:Transmembrane protein, putative n=1 Tax=Tetrahymena thermophila (strain SB210) TaxID=312017 RepID=Q23TV6_TETTS|nr:transmembrane protein, putative [Tetrahymena thermophila SB210]EAR99939.2 transmembrane protein, putative [Tetrahymena thermophila SB210]|eukprot:XP_001020184.2 transmembrane protein, putative [Tetrahymena thermophila SB210]